MTLRQWPVICTAVLGAILGAASSPAQEPSGLQAATALEGLLVDAIAKAEKSVVAVAGVPAADGGQLPQRATQPDFIPDRFGSGVVIDAKGLILTNHHVLGDVKSSAYCVWIDRKPYPAKVKAADPWLDLAVLSIEADDLLPMPLGDSKDLKKGQIVISLGNPYAIARDGQPSASYGIVANLLRPAPRPKDTAERGEGRETLHHYGNLIHTDCRLELGTSGGALVNLKGEMVGLTTSLAALMGYERSGGFAIPVDDAFRRAVESLKAGRLPEYGFLGVAPRDLSDEMRRSGAFGAAIETVRVGTPAAKGGLQKDDVITHIDRKKVPDVNALMRFLGSHAPETQLTLTIQRGLTLTRPGETKETVVELSKKRVESRRPGFAEVVSAPWRGLTVDYATVSRTFLDQSIDLDPDGSIAVIDVIRDSPAWRAGLRPGDFISHVGKTRVATPKQFFTAVEGNTSPVELTMTGIDAAKAERAVLPESPVSDAP